MGCSCAKRKSVAEPVWSLQVRQVTKRMEVRARFLISDRSNRALTWRLNQEAFWTLLVNRGHGAG